MRRVYTILVFIITTAINYLCAQSIDEDHARIVAANFLSPSNTGKVNARSSNNLNLVYKSTSSSTDPTSTNYSTPFFYVYNIGSDNGFIIVAGSEKARPILGYSYKGHFDGANIPNSIEKWLESYKNEIRFANNSDLIPSNETQTKWDDLKNGRVPKNTNQRVQAVAPLTKTVWDQHPYYNDLCPYSSQASAQTVTGCVATAMAQIMKFWNYPSSGTGFHSDVDPNFGVLPANFGGTAYNWSSMPNNVTSSNNAVATLMYDCGVSVDMQYGVQESTAYMNLVVSALKNYFGYSNNVQFVQRANYSNTDWTTLLKTELNAGRPVAYSGVGSVGGHAFVCDGYDDTGLFSFNWGWGGLSNGYFALNALDPGSLGTGGGLGGFNSNQAAIIGIQPPTSAINYNLGLYDYVTPSSSTIGYGQSFTISTNIINKSSSQFVGDYCAAVFDKNQKFVSYVEIYSGNTLPGGDVYTSDVVFSNNGVLGMLPGNYSVGIFYRPTGGQWIQVANNGSYTNMIQIVVVNNNPIQLSSSITITSGSSLTQGQPASFNLNLVNNGSTTFTGSYKVGLYNVDSLGTLAQNINTLTESNGLPAGYTYSSPLTFSTNSVSVKPGTYYLAVEYAPTGGAYSLVGVSSTFENPIYVTVQVAPLQPDKYEPNNTASQPTTLPLVFTGNTATTNTSGSNIHTGSDIDYYKISLPTGATYTITATLNDNNNQPSTYSLDAVYSYSTDGGTTWSDVLNSTGPATVNTSGASTVYFLVAPFFVGQTGTYLLNLAVSKNNITEVAPNLYEEILEYPNPSRDQIFVDTRNYSGTLQSISVLNIQGQLLLTKTSDSVNNVIPVSLGELSNGIYILSIQTNRGLKTIKVILQK